MGNVYGKAPDKIEVPFEYENNIKTSYYTLSCPGFHIERVQLEGIYSFIEELDENELEETHIAYMTPTEHGWQCDWRLTGTEFYKRAELAEITSTANRSAGNERLYVFDNF